MPKVKLHSKVDFSNDRESQSWAEEVRRIIIPENNHYVGESGEPAFITGWSNYSSTFTPATFYKQLDRVFIEGLVKHSSGGAGTTIFTLPEGYRPEKRHIFIVSANDKYGRVDVYANGNVEFYNAGATPSASTYLTLSGISFRI